MELFCKYDSKQDKKQVESGEYILTSEQRQMIEYTTEEVITYLMEDNDISMEQAMEQFYMSDTFDKLHDVETGLYLDGSAYIYEMLKREVQCEKTSKR